MMKRPRTPRLPCSASVGRSEWPATSENSAPRRCASTTLRRSGLARNKILRKETRPIRSPMMTTIEPKLTRVSRFTSIPAANARVPNDARVTQSDSPTYSLISLSDGQRVAELNESPNMIAPPVNSAAKKAMPTCPELTAWVRPIGSINSSIRAKTTTTTSPIRRRLWAATPISPPK